MPPLAEKLEALLFFRCEPVTFEEAASILETDVASVRSAASDLSQSLRNRGIRVVVHGAALQMVTAPEHHELIEKVKRSEVSTELTRAGAETLAVIAYRGPATKAQIDHIRGVNSAGSIRNLLVRGLIERDSTNGDMKGAPTYRVTSGLLSHLGIESADALPDMERFRSELNQFEHQTV